MSPDMPLLIYRGGGMFPSEIFKYLLYSSILSEKSHIYNIRYFPLLINMIQYKIKWMIIYGKQSK